MAAVMEPRLHVRPMTRFDLTEVTAIEADSYPYPWSRGIFGDCLRVGYCCRVVEADGETVGYAILSMAAGEAHILNLCVDEGWRHAGLGGVLLETLLLEARLARARRVFLEVRPTNRAARALYRKFGFRVIGRRPAYYPSEEGREDAVIMALHLEA